MFTLPSIGTKVTADIAPIEKSFDTIGKSSHELSISLSQDFRKVDQAIQSAGIGAGASGLKGLLSGLKGDLGKSSIVGQLGKLAEGGGAIMDLTLISSEIEKAADMGAKLADSIRAGDGNAQQLATDFAKSIPVLGSLISAGQSIREMLTGEQYAIDQINEEAAKVNMTIDAGNKIMAESKNAVLKINNEVGHLRDVIFEMQGVKSFPLFKAASADITQLLVDAGAGFSKIDDVLGGLGKEGINGIGELQKRIDKLKIEAARDLPKNGTFYTTSGPYGSPVEHETDEFTKAKDARDAAGKELSRLQTLLKSYQEARAGIFGGTSLFGQVAGALDKVKSLVNTAKLPALPGLDLFPALLGKTRVSLFADLAHEFSESINGSQSGVTGAMERIGGNLAESFGLAGAKAGEKFWTGLADWSGANNLVSARSMEIRAEIDSKLKSAALDARVSGENAIEAAVDRFKASMPDATAADIAKYRASIEQSSLNDAARRARDFRADSFEQPRLNNAFPDFIRANSYDALKYQFSQQRDKSDDESKKQTALLKEIYQAIDRQNREVNFSIMADLPG